MSYRCQGDTAKFPEGGTIICESGKGIQSPKSVCKVECDVGSPNYAEIECKQTHGWRPTNQLECTGVAPGVVVAVLFAGFLLVILVAFGYAKYKQSVKKKELKRNPPPPKNNARRPGKVVGGGNPTPKPASQLQPIIKPTMAPVVTSSGQPTALSASQSDYGSKVSHNSDGSSKAKSARKNPRRPNEKQRRATTRKQRPPHEQPGGNPENWHFRNHGYEYNEMVPPDGYPPYGGYDPYSYDSYQHDSTPHVGFQDRYAVPPPRPQRGGGVYSVTDHMKTNVIIEDDFSC